MNRLSFTLRSSETGLTKRIQDINSTGKCKEFSVNLMRARYENGFVSLLLIL